MQTMVIWKFLLYFTPNIGVVVVVILQVLKILLFVAFIYRLKHLQLNIHKRKNQICGKREISVIYNFYSKPWNLLIKSVKFKTKNKNVKLNATQRLFITYTGVSVHILFSFCFCCIANSYTSFYIIQLPQNKPKSKANENETEFFIARNTIQYNTTYDRRRHRHGCESIQ